MNETFSSMIKSVQFALAITQTSNFTSNARLRQKLVLESLYYCGWFCKPYHIQKCLFDWVFGKHNSYSTQFEDKLQFVKAERITSAIASHSDSIEIIFSWNLTVEIYKSL